LRNFKSSELKGEEKGLLKISIGRTCTEVNFALDQLRPLYLLISQGHNRNRKDPARKIKKDSEPPKVSCLLPDNFPTASLVKVKQYYEIPSHHQHFIISKEFKSYTNI